MPYKITFGTLQTGLLTRRIIEEALADDWVSEGPNVREFEAQFADKFGWRHAIATSSGTDAGIVVWSAVRELANAGHLAEFANLDSMLDKPGRVVTPACAFTATANCLLAAGFVPQFMDIDLNSLNVSLKELDAFIESADNDYWAVMGGQFIANMGIPTSVMEFATRLRKDGKRYVIGDFCEAHGAMITIDESPDYKPSPRTFTRTVYADHLCDAAIYSFYAAHQVIAGEGGMICTDDDELAEVCRSVKCHGYGPGPRFNFQRIGYNSKMNELTAAVGLESLERFDETFAKRRRTRALLMDRLSEFEDRLILYPDGRGEVISPHAFPVVLRDETADMMPLFRHLEDRGVECKTLFGSLPTQHKAFEFLGHKLGDFPVAERVGRTGLHFGCHEGMMAEDVDYVWKCFKEFFEG